MAEKGPPGGKKWFVTFGKNNYDMNEKYITAYGNQLKNLTKILRKNKKKILRKIAS